MPTLCDRAETADGAAGGTTVANNRRVGLLWLATNLKFPLDVDNPVVLGVANPQASSKLGAAPI